MNWIIEKLSQEKKKITTPRKEVVSWLITHKKVFSTKEIIDDLKQLDRVSVYRTIELLTSLDVIHPVFVKEGEQYYELHQPTSHHHHIICDNCGDSKCVPCQIQKNIVVKGFKKIHHIVSFRGICTNCN